MSTAGVANLVSGDVGLRKLNFVARHVECPSLSPDNRSIVFKKRVGAGGAWRLYVMDLTTTTERPIAVEARYVDDQVEWLDNQRILYSLRRASSTVSDVWVTPIDDSAAPRVFLPEAESPVVIR
jgi:nitrogen fixation protein